MAMTNGTTLGLDQLSLDETIPCYYTNSRPPR